MRFCPSWTTFWSQVGVSGREAGHNRPVREVLSRRQLPGASLRGSSRLASSQACSRLLGWPQQVRGQSLSHLPQASRKEVVGWDGKQVGLPSAPGLASLSGGRKKRVHLGPESQICVWEPGKEPLRCGEFPRVRHGHRDASAPSRRTRKTDM